VKVALREIPCHRRIELGPQLVGAVVAGLPMRQALERPDEDPDAGEAVAELDLQMDEDNVFVRGHLAGRVDVACSRCVGPVHLPIAEDLFVTYMPASRMPDEPDDVDIADVEVEPATADEDDVDLYPYEGEEINLEPLLREQILLAVPYAPLCREDCKGLCPVCGTDLNAGQCPCDRTPIDPRWSALKGLKS
jgi:uncharacterized protein